MNGNGEAGVMVRTPAGGSVMANWIVLVPPAVALAEAIAARSEPAPVSLVVVTVNVSAEQGRTAAASKPDKYKEILVALFILSGTVRRNLQKRKFPCSHLIA